LSFFLFLLFFYRGALARKRDPSVSFGPCGVSTAAPKKPRTLQEPKSSKQAQIKRIPVAIGAFDPILMP
jgi:hypothetical protein